MVLDGGPVKGVWRGYLNGDRLLPDFVSSERVDRLVYGGQGLVGGSVAMRDMK
jgi:hypothetical protein